MKDPNKENARSEEVQDIVDRMPTSWTLWFTIIVTCIMAITVILSIVIKYPDTVTGEVRITATHAPVRLVAGVSGRLHLLRNDRDTVARGTVIAYIEQGANLEDVLLVDRMTQRSVNLDSRIKLPHGLILGDLSNSYNGFVLAYEQLDQLRNTKLYRNMRKSLKEKILVDSNLVDNINHELVIKKDILNNVQERLRKDSLLEDNGALSKEDLTNQHNNYLSQQESHVNLMNSKISKQSEIKQNKVEMARTDIEEYEKIQSAYYNMVTAFNKLASDVRQWKERYLFVSTIQGRVEYLGFWRENSFVQATEEVFSVLPVHNSVFGEAYIPAVGAGKVEVGQDVNIKLNDFPDNEYGHIKGRVVSISDMANKIQTPNGEVETYRVKIQLPKGTTTNFGKQLELKYEAKGVADVITKKKRLIERLFDNLKSHGDK